MVNQELDYEIPIRTLTWAWLLAAAALLLVGLWTYHAWVMAGFVALVLVWTNFYSTVMHFALDAEEFTTRRWIGPAFVRFQSHHFPQWIHVIHRKPVLDLIGELNPMALLNLVGPLVLFRLHTRAVFVTWAAMMLCGSYAMICHRWAHMPARPRIVRLLQRYHLALDPTEHWHHHALAVNPNGRMVVNYDLSFGWSNGLFNRLLRVAPSARLWLVFLAVATFTQVVAFAQLLQWMQRAL